MNQSRLQKQSGFSLIEVLISTSIVAVIILATSESTVRIFKQLKKAEKVQEVIGESLDVTRYIRRTLKNLSLSRLDQPNLFLLLPSGALQAMGPNPKPPIAAMTINVTDWLVGGEANPLYAKARAAFPSLTSDVFLDSFLLEEFNLISQSGGLVKQTRRLIVSRCDSLNNFFNAASIQAQPAVTALHILGGMSRRPFISNNSNSVAQVNCCPPTNPGCGDGSFLGYFFRTYVINLDSNQRVTNVEEFPKSNDKNPVIGSGFGLYFQNWSGTSVTIQNFTITNTCLISIGTPPTLCNQLTDLSSIMSAGKSQSEILKINRSSISTSVSNDIVDTGVITL